MNRSPYLFFFLINTENTYNEMTTRPTMNPPAGHNFLEKALKGGETWAKHTIARMPACNIPVDVVDMATAIVHNFIENAREPTYTVDNIIRINGASYWNIVQQGERIRSPHRFAPASVRVNGVKQRMHSMATFRNLRILLHSVLAVTIESIIVRRDGNGTCMYDGMEIKRVVVAKSSRPTMWAPPGKVD